MWNALEAHRLKYCRTTYCLLPQPRVLVTQILYDGNCGLEQAAELLTFLLTCQSTPTCHLRDCLAVAYALRTCLLDELRFPHRQNHAVYQVPESTSSHLSSSRMHFVAHATFVEWSPGCSSPSCLWNPAQCTSLCCLSQPGCIALISMFLSRCTYSQCVRQLYQSNVTSPANRALCAACRH
jgi:hypothetical protein